MTDSIFICEIGRLNDTHVRDLNWRDRALSADIRGNGVAQTIEGFVARLWTTPDFAAPYQVVALIAADISSTSSI